MVQVSCLFDEHRLAIIRITKNVRLQTQRFPIRFLPIIGFIIAQSYS